MSTMPAEVYRAFRAAGVAEDIAEAAASVIPYKDDLEDLATEQDMVEVESRSADRGRRGES